MPRNSSGDYSLPAGNPVTSGTPISSSVQNTTMSDMATALTDSLSRSGKGGMLVPFQLADGTVAAPSLAFTSDPTTGLYKPGTGQFAVSVQGVQAWQWNGVGASPANVNISYQPLYQRIAAVNYPVLNTKSDYTVAGSNQIQGQWEFTYNPTTFKGPQIAGAGAMLSFSHSQYYSGVVRVQSVAPGASDGKPGDIYLVV